MPVPAKQFTITGTAEVTISNTITAEQLGWFVERVPPEATITVTNYAGDQRDPGYTILKATWAL